MLEKTLCITEQVWPEEEKALLSICCLTYNQEAYIAETIEGFLIQETTFKVEILVHDDASTDKTPEIIRDYQRRYPALIKPIFQIENQYSKGIHPVYSLIQKSNAPFIALCEGDDFWNHPLKIESQVKFLQDNPGVVLSFHDVISVDEEGRVVSESKIEEVIGCNQSKILDNYLEVSNALIPTLSIVFRNEPIIIGPNVRNIINNDSYLFSRLFFFGSMHNIDMIMGAHRRHSGGIWTSMDVRSRHKQHIISLKAIAWDIEAINCSAACFKLALTCWKYGIYSVREDRGRFAMYYIVSYFSSLIYSCRCVALGSRGVVTGLLTQLRILFIPFESVKRTLRINF